MRTGLGFGLWLFQSTLPVGGATPYTLCRHVSLKFQATLPVGGATHQGLIRQLRVKISIHAPRGGSDVPEILRGVNRFDFNPRSPWGERLDSKNFLRGKVVFQSTLPVGGATPTPG